MCFQGFVHHGCGCIRLFEDECDYATELEAVPFYSKVACPNYTIARRNADLDCGKDGLYCANTPDAAYLDYVHSCKAKCELDMANIDRYINEQIHPQRQTAMRMIEEKYPGDMALMKQAYMSQPQCVELDQNWAGLLQKKRQFAAGLSQANHVLRYARDFYMLQRHAYGPLVGNKQPLPDVLKNFQATNPAAIAGQHMAGQTGNMRMLPSNIAHSIIPPPVQPAASGSLAFHPQPTPPETISQSDPFASTSTRTKRQRQLQPNFPSAETKESPRKRGRGSKKSTATNDIPDDTSPNVRRSTRVRGKKVNYNEEAFEDLPSRTPSPEKSDASSYSPSKSDIVSDRVGVKASRSSSSLVRSSTSLRDIIGEFQKHAGTNISPARRPPSRSQATGGTPQKDDVPQIRVDSPRSGTPDTDILHPEDPRHDGSTQIPMQYNLPQTRPGVLPNGDPDPAMLAFQLAHQNTRLQAMNRSLTHDSAIRLQSTPRQTPPDTSDPKKRQMPASSPAMGSKKRVQLTYPWANNSPDQSMSASSPPRMASYMQRQDSGIGHSRNPSNELSMGSSMRPPPPPPMFRSSSQTFKPSGLSQVSPMQDVFPADASLAAAVTVPADSFHSSGEADAVQGQGMSDLDWALLSDGSKF